MILGLNHVAMSVPDLDQALAFYRDLLGFPVAFEYGWERGTPLGEAAGAVMAVKNTAARAVQLRAGDALIELFEFTSGDPRPQDPDRPVVDHGYTHICLAVSDLDAEYTRLKEAGLRCHCPPTQVAPGVRTLYARDPFGNVIELEESAGRTSSGAAAITG